MKYKVSLTNAETINYVAYTIKKFNLRTVCQSSHCPNIFECYSKGIATFLISGDICTRNCKFCNITTGIPGKPDIDEPNKVALAAKFLSLNHVVITSVTRDDLPDGGSRNFFLTIKMLKKMCPEIITEVLVPDFKNNETAVNEIVEAGVDIFNHNIETVPELSDKIQPEASYERSIYLLEKVKQISKNTFTKSGLIVGLGETKEQIELVMKDLVNVKCDLLTIGQYLPPSSGHYALDRLWTNYEFAELVDIGLSLGFKQVLAGSNVRSSYKAGELLSYC